MGNNRNERKTKYHKQVQPRLNDVRRWLRSGWGIHKIAKELGISPTTFYKYMDEHDELRNIINFGKVENINRVENTLLRKALGYTYEEITSTPDGEIIHQKYSHPDIRAIRMYLFNTTKGSWYNGDDIDVRKRGAEARKVELEVEVLLRALGVGEEHGQVNILDNLVEVLTKSNKNNTKGDSEVEGDDK